MRLGVFRGNIWSLPFVRCVVVAAVVVIAYRAFSDQMGAIRAVLQPHWPVATYAGDDSPDKVDNARLSNWRNISDCNQHPPQLGVRGSVRSCRLVVDMGCLLLTVTMVRILQELRPRRLSTDRHNAPDRLLARVARVSLKGCCARVSRALYGCIGTPGTP